MPKQFQVTAKFFMASGEVKRVDWVEDSLVVQIPLNDEKTEFDTKPIEDVDTALFHFRKFFLNLITEPPGGRPMKPFSVENIKGKLSIVNMKRVEYIEVDVQEYKEESTDEKG